MIDADMFKKFFNQFYLENIEWCRGKNWKLRLPVLIWFGYVLIRHWGSSEYGSILAPVNLGVHEFGHLLFSFFGQFLGILGGTLVELSVPFILMVNFYRQRDFFAISFCFGWLSTALFDVSRYIADARKMELPLVSPFGGGDSIIHDWNYLLTHLGLLSFDQVLAVFVSLCASFSMFACILGGGWMLWQMKRSV